VGFLNNGIIVLRPLFNHFSVSLPLFECNFFKELFEGRAEFMGNRNVSYFRIPVLSQSGGSETSQMNSELLVKGIDGL
jgi:hypothetical protein